MAVTVTNVGGQWVIHFPISDEDFVVSPEGSTRKKVGDAIRYGTDGTYLEVSGTGNARTFTVKESGQIDNFVMDWNVNKNRKTTAAEKETAFAELEAAWKNAMETGAAAAGGSRLNVKRRRTQRNTRNNKRRKLRKLATRRR